jgi:hypothetical protein
MLHAQRGRGAGGSYLKRSADLIDRDQGDCISSEVTEKGQSINPPVCQLLEVERRLVTLVGSCWFLELLKEGLLWYT